MAEDFIRVRGGLKLFSIGDQLFSLVDVYATVAQLTGQELTAGAAPDSLDLSSVLLGKTKKNVRDNTVLHGIG